jgi:hypothetical protein
MAPGTERPSNVRFQGKALSVTAIEVYVKVKPEFGSPHNASILQLSLEEGVTAPTVLLHFAAWNGRLQGKKENLLWNVPIVDEEGASTLTALRNTREGLDPNALDEIFVVCYYTVS